MNAVSIVGLCFSGVMLLVSIINFVVGTSRTSRAEIDELKEGILKANMKLDQVCATTNDIKTDIKAMDKKITEHSEKIAVLTRDLETAFLRIDELRQTKEDKTNG